MANLPRGASPRSGSWTSRHVITGLIVFWLTHPGGWLNPLVAPQAPADGHKQPLTFQFAGKDGRMTPRYAGKSRTKFHLLVTICVIIALAVSAGLFCHAGIGRGMEASKAFKHALTTASALIGVVLTIGQAIKSFQKAQDHHNVKPGAPDDRAEVETNDYNFHHLFRVGILWTVGAIAAALTVAGELVDFYNDGPTWM